jgi:PAS domain S-box-containing protein
MESDTSGTSRRLASTLAIVLVMMSVATLIVAGSFGIIFLFQSQQDAIAGKQRVVAHQAANAVAGFIQQKFSVLEAAVRLTRTGEERQRALQVLLGMQPAFRQLLLLDEKKQQLFRVSRMSQTESRRIEEHLGNDLFSEVKQGNRYIGSVYVDQVTSEPLVIMAVPVTAILGDVLGALVVEVNLKFMWDLMDRLEVGATGYAYVVDRGGHLIAFEDIGRVLKGEKLDHLRNVADFINAPRHGNDAGVHISTGINGSTVVGTYVSLGTPDWAVITELPVKEAYRPVLRSALTSAAILLTMALLAILFGVVVARRLAVPILNLTDTATRIEGGEMELQAVEEGPREVVRLAGAFNNMTDRLRAMLDAEEERARQLAREVEQRRKVEAALKENASVLMATLESTHDGVLVADEDKTVSHFNTRFAEIWSIPDDLLARGNDNLLIDYVLPQLVEPEQFISKIENLYQSAEPSEDTLPLKDGRVLERSSYPLVRDGRGGGRVWFFRDVSERVKAVEELRQLRNYLGNIINSMPSVLVGVDNAGRVTQWNRQAELVTGVSFDAARARPLNEVFPRLMDQMDRIQQAIANRQVIREPKVPINQQGEIRYEDVTIFPLTANGVEGAVIRVDDITERIRLEEMMIQSEKMLSIGGLAAGMAHEVNNPLAGILQSNDVLHNRLFGDLPANRQAAEDAGTTLAAIRRYLELRNLPAMLENIRTSGNRAAAIVRNMLSFARKGDRVVSNHDLGDLLDQTLDLVRTDYDMKKHYDFKKIRIEKKYNGSVPAVPCEPGKLQQVFLNILKNGAEAMAETAGIRPLSTFTLRVEDDGAWVRVEIEDNGPGMDEKTRRSIFDPFFTTKPVGKGTGLGLSVSYYIITEDHGGEMEAYAVGGGGTRFVIHLPKAGRQRS